jgi:hypothetical protein
MKRTALLTLLFLTAVLALPATETSSSVTLIGSSAPEIQVEAKYSIKQPVLVGQGALTSGNNIKLDLVGKASPVSVNAAATAVLTPIAILEFSVGGQVGTAWTFPLGDLYGIQISPDVGVSNTEEDPLSGIYYKGKAGAAFQFDTGAVFPGEWSSVIIRVYQEIYYRAWTGAEDDQMWDYELSGGLVNGLNYYGSYFLGYRMPIILNTIGLLLETDTYNIDGDYYDDTFYTLGIIANFGLTDTLSMTLIPQWNTKDTDADTHYTETRDLGWGRFAFQFTWRF